MISTLYKIDNEVVFYSPTLQPRMGELCTKLLTGESTGYDHNGNIIDIPTSATYCQLICGRYIGNDIVNKIYANVILAPVILSIVRSDMINLPVEQGLSVLTKMKDVVDAVTNGMFNSASQLLLYKVEPDEYLTRQRLDLYASMLISADAIK